MSQEAVLEVTGVGCTLGGVRALRSVDLVVRASELVGIVGPNGAGKTTLFNAVTGYVPIDRGEVIWQQQSLRGKSPHWISRAGLVRTFQNAGGLTAMTVGENLAVAARTWASSEIDRVVKLLDLTGDLRTRVQDCSLATRKLVGIAMAAVQQPAMLLLDEPLAGLDPSDRERVVQVIRDVHEHSGVAVLLIEHDINRTLALADRVAILDVGSKVAEGTPSELAGRDELHDVYLKA